MDLKREKRRVYLRCFALLLALWLALLGAFSAYMLANARRQERQRFKDDADALGEALQDASDQDLRPAYGDWLSIVRTYEGTNGIAAALYTAEGELEWHTDPAGQWTVFLSNSSRYWSVTDGTVDITRWFSVEELREIAAAAQAQSTVSTSLVLEDVILTADGEVVPRSLALQTSGGDTVMTLVNGSYDQSQYRGTAYAFGYIFLSTVRPAAALAAAVNSQVVRALQTIAADPSVLRAPGADYPRYLGGKAIVDDVAVTERPWGPLDQVYIAQTTDPIRPDCWLVITGMSDVWDAAGPYWLATALISLAGFLLAAWLLAHMTWKGQRAHLLYERRRRETAAAITHDLKTPLAVIRACAENLAEAAPPDGQGDYAAEIIRQTEGMDRSLLDILELDRLEGQAPVLQLEDVPLEEVVSRQVEALQPLWPEIQVVQQVSGTVRADRAALSRLVENLLRNALEHSDGTVQVQGDETVLTVYNTGLPIPEEDLPRIWEPYFKGDAARRGGSGLGLSIVAAAARDHDWRWEAANSDGGVTFTIRFNA